MHVHHESVRRWVRGDCQLTFGVCYPQAAALRLRRITPAVAALAATPDMQLAAIPDTAARLTVRRREELPIVNLAIPAAGVSFQPARAQPAAQLTDPEPVARTEAAGSAADSLLYTITANLDAADSTPQVPAVAPDGHPAALQTTPAEAHQQEPMVLPSPAHADSSKTVPPLSRQRGNDTADPTSAAEAPANGAALVGAAVARPPAEEHFVTVGQDGNFMAGCRTFFPAGWNQCAAV